MRSTADAAVYARSHTGSMGRRSILLASLAAALAAAAAVAALELSSGHSARPVALTGVARTESMLRGIRQTGTALGSPSAAVTLVEFADPQCPYCGMWARDALPAIVDRYVRPGKVRIVFTGMTFVGSDSETALRTALAAGHENRFWDVLELLYENQGQENSGWVTDSLLRSIGAAVPGLDTNRMFAERSSTGVGDELTAAAGVARDAGIDSTPSFAVGRTGGRLQVVHPTSLAASGLTPALDAALAQ